MTVASTTPQLEASYAACKKFAGQSRSTFLLSFLLLDKPKQQAMYALYAFCRYCDDLADSDATTDQRRLDLAAWRADFHAALEQRTSTRLSNESLSRAQQILPAIADVVQRFEIPQSYLDAVITGVEMDLQSPRYQSFSELADYCHHVASAVGKACLHIWGFEDNAKSLALAEDCGLAFQLTNIIRDIGEDARMQRIYLPREDLDGFGVSPALLSSTEPSSARDELLRFELNRADEHFQRSKALQQYLSPQGRKIFGGMHATYHALAEKLRANLSAIPAKRVSLSRWQKGWLVLRYGLLQTGGKIAASEKTTAEKTSVAANPKEV